MKPFLPILLLAAAAAGAAEMPPQPTVITSDHLVSESTDTQTVTDCDGHVVVTGTNLELRCDHLHMITTRLTEKSATLGHQTGFKTLVATGHVRILQTQGAREALCGRAEVFPDQDKIVLTIDPVVIFHDSGTRATGDEIDLLRSKRMVTGVHVRIDAPPVKDLGFDRNSPQADAPSAAAAPSSR